MQHLITRELINKGIGFDDYMALTRRIVADETPGGRYANPKTHRYTRSNLERMEKVLQYMTIQQKLYNAVSDLQEEWIWLVISEPWCGDASWGTPALYMIASGSEQIDFRIILRDEHPDIMHAYQTKGTDSIPKLVCLRRNDLKELGTWGPRPQVLQEMVMAARQKGDENYREAVRQLHSWYEADMNKTMQEELTLLVKEWK